MILGWMMVTGCGHEESFTAINSEILTPSCGFSSCHGGGEAGLTVDAASTYLDLVNVESTVVDGEIRVVPGDPDASYLIVKLEDSDRIVDDVMPPSNPLDADAIERIRDWIAQGALDN